jgi:glycosyltransferase involved in cell wall biosynthesis
MAGGTSTDPTYGKPGGYLDKLRQRIADKGLQDLVEWDLDVDGRDIPALFHRHHALVLPPGAWRPAIWLGRRRSSSGALNWATACGRGVIAPKVRTYEEDVQGGLGESYKSGDAAALAQCLKQLAAEPARAQAWAQAASECAARRDWAFVGQALRAHFDAVLARRGLTARNSSKP